MTSQGLPLIAALGVAIVLCFTIGWLLGYPALRVQHHYLAFVTLAFSTLAFLVFRNEDWLTKGIYGISNIPRPNILGFPTNRPLPFYYLCLGRSASSRSRCGGLSARLGAAPLWRCAKIRSGRSRLASIRGAIP